MAKDELFKGAKSSIKKFKFNKKVSSVFDDMIERSVPLYGEVQRMLMELTVSNSKDNTNIYDIGCSTGSTLLNLLKNIKSKKIKFIGVDSSDAMLDVAKKKLARNNVADRCKLVNWDINENIKISNSSVVILCLALQFTKPDRRHYILKSIFNGLRKNGCLIFVEKIYISDREINKKFIEYYYRHKVRNGYSVSEIKNKEQSLKNTLIPKTYPQNIKLLQGVGFKRMEEFFRWYNFFGIIAFKD